MSFLFGGFSGPKLTAALMGAKHRIRLHHEKRRNEMVKSKKEIATLVRRRSENASMCS
jgi:hypothetical protein